MSEGSAVPTYRRWLITQLQANSALDAVRVQYTPVANNSEAVGDNGRIEAVYWAEAVSTVAPRAFKGGANVKYDEDATSTLVVAVVGRDADDNLEVIESRAASILGEIVKEAQTGQPTSPGAHLPRIVGFVSGWTLTVETLTRGGAGVPAFAAVYEIEFNINAHVEQ